MELMEKPSEDTRPAIKKTKQRKRRTAQAHTRTVKLKETKG